VTVALLATDDEALAVGDALRWELAGWPDRAPSNSRRWWGRPSSGRSGGLHGARHPAHPAMGGMRHRPRNPSPTSSVPACSAGMCRSAGRRPTPAEPSRRLRPA